MDKKENVTLTEEQHQAMIDVIRTGFPLEMKFKKLGIEIEKTIQVLPNEHVATILILKKHLGLSLSDVLNLKLGSIITESNRYRLDIPTELYAFIQEYAIKNGRNPQQKFFTISERAVRQTIERAAVYLGYEDKGQGGL